ncbi:VWA domain-containing protein [Labrys wisconsinensis]|uniref:Mg-chelatase subunit ChlD n=1 Tax=Labrys wisconsinensis TaxID=425677 RepID=A0ABU0JFQ8_9HYPH|nr:VWA domain-containing protein [Labrys wisconsinensis]MDQ0473124.1 Mg-chelatase subunit ChlD [Labrys wisconsinensis]
MSALSEDDEAGRLRRWRLALGGDDAEGLGERDRRLDQALAGLYDTGPDSGGRRAGLGASAPRVARWLGDIREFFPASVVQVMQKDAFDRLGLKQMLLEPEFLAALEPDVHLIADLVALRSAMPEKAKDTARQVVAKVVAELMARLESRTVEMVRGALNRQRRTSRPRFPDIDWPRTIARNLRHWQAEHRTIVPERLVGYGRSARRSHAEEVILCVDQSGSMATSVVYSSIFAAVLASIPAIATRLVVFDTAVLDLSEELKDPVEVLFGVQLGGGTDINQALAFCERLVLEPARTHLVLITDLYEGGNAAEMLARARSLVAAGVNLIVLLALNDDGRPGYDARHAAAFAALGAPVFACSPDQFPDLMAAALKREDIAAWAAARDIALIRADGEAG